MIFFQYLSPLFQAGELDILSAVIKWGEHQLIKRLEERGNCLQYIIIRNSVMSKASFLKFIHLSA